MSVEIFHQKLKNTLLQCVFPRLNPFPFFPPNLHSSIQHVIFLAPWG